MKNFYITTTLPYINSDPHVGFAMEIVRADVIARYKKSFGYDVFFNTGTDEHGQKIWNRAKDENKSIEDFCNENSDKYYDNIKTYTTINNNHVKPTKNYNLIYGSEYQEDHDPKYF